MNNHPIKTPNSILVGFFVPIATTEADCDNPTNYPSYQWPRISLIPFSNVQSTWNSFKHPLKEVDIWYFACTKKKTRKQQNTLFAWFGETRSRIGFDEAAVNKKKSWMDYTLWKIYDDGVPATGFHLLFVRSTFQHVKDEARCMSTVDYFITNF